MSFVVKSCFFFLRRDRDVFFDGFEFGELFPADFVLQEHVVVEDQRVHVGAEEAFDGVLGGAADRFAAAAR